MGGIVSSAYCLLYKLYTLKLTKKQINASLDQRRNPGNGSRYDAPDKYSQNFNDRNQDYSKSGSSESKRRDNFEGNEGSYSRDRRSRSRDRISKSKEEKHRNRRSRSRSRSKDRRTKDRHRDDREKGHKHHRR